MSAVTSKTPVESASALPPRSPQTMSAVAGKLPVESASGPPPRPLRAMSAVTSKSTVESAAAPSPQPPPTATASTSTTAAALSGRQFLWHAVHLALGLTGALRAYSSLGLSTRDMMVKGIPGADSMVCASETQAKVAEQLYAQLKSALQGVSNSPVHATYSHARHYGALISAATSMGTAVRMLETFRTGRRMPNIYETLALEDLVASLESQQAAWKKQCLNMMGCIPSSITSGNNDDGATSNNAGAQALFY